MNNTLNECWQKAKKHAAEFGDIDTLRNISLWYEYARNSEEKAAWHVIIKNLQQKEGDLPFLPNLPNV